MPSQHNFVFVCKTFRDDYDSFSRLLKSYKLHNIDNIPLYVSVPDSDISLFRSLVGDDAKLISDESYAEQYFTSDSYWGLSLGYINQEICKLSFWESNISKNYLCVDSDVYFIRDFYVDDFMANEDTPYSVLVMDKDLNTETFYKEFSQPRADLIRKIFETVDYDDRRFRTCHGMTVLNSAVLESLKNDFMGARSLSYKDLIEISPYEYSWYNAWLQKSEIIKVIAVEPFFKTFHLRFEYVIARLKLISEVDIAKQYVGVILNSNWTPKGPPTAYEDPNSVHNVIYRLINKIG